MRPVHLQLTAFGPYQGTQAIDFGALGAGDLFLIHGPTGAGKTSIFDGLTYALYGALAGTREVDQLRADRAAADQATQVIFRFRLGEVEYQVERTPEWEREKKVGQGKTTAIATASLWRAGAAAPLASGPSKVTEAVEALLGMDVEQFTQVALLPQGEFKRLLCADSGEREQLLQRLFATDRYSRVEDLLVERKKALDTRGAKLKERQAEVLGGEPAEALEARLAGARAGVAEAAAVEAARRAEDGEALRRLSAAQMLQGRFDEQARARAEDERARAEAPGLAADRRRLALAEAAERARAALDLARRTEADAAARARDREAAARDLAAADAAQASAVAGLAAAEAAQPERARRAARIQVLEQALPDLQRLAGRERAQAALRAAAGESAAALARAGQALAEAERRPTALEAEAARLRPLAAEVGARAEAGAAATAAATAAAERDGLESQAKARSDEVAAAERALAQARQAAAGAARTAAALDAAREGGLAAELARKVLRDGEPCPVCGATDHPAPATAHGAVPEKEDVERARAEEKRAADVAAVAEAARSRLAGLLAEVEGRAGAARAAEPRPALALQASAANAAAALAEAREAATRLEALDRDLGLARRRVEEARALREASAAADAKAREEAARGEAERAELARSLAQAGVEAGAVRELARLRPELAALEGAAGKARADHDAAAGRRSAAGARLAAAGEALERARAAAAESLAAATAACAAEGFADLAACQAALLPGPDRTVLVASVERRAAAGLAAAGRVAELDAELLGRHAPDLAAARAARAATEQAAHAASGARAGQEAEVRRLEGLTARLGQLAAELAEVAAALAVQGQVAELVRGRNARGMSLQRFVLAARLEEVAAAASEQLRVMSRGRFRLRHHDGVARKNSAAGLSLVVEDAHTGVDDRPVGALSGGEAFLASLSLALGLSEVVMRRSGGRRLDALFVDEGFGTLDEATLDVAIQALEGLRRSGRMVGIISHVPELRRRIPARIEVRHGEGGAVAVVHPA